MIPKTIQSWMETYTYGHYQPHYQPAVNANTLNEGYWIEHAGSLMSGEANTSNYLVDIFTLAKKYGFDHFTRIRKLRKNPEKLWEFSGNLEKISHVFCVWVWDEKLAHRIYQRIRSIKKRGLAK